MKNKNLLPALTLFAFVWILGFVVFKVLHLIGISWWWILLPLLIGVALAIVFQVKKVHIIGMKIDIIALVVILIIAGVMSMFTGGVISRG